MPIVRRSFLAALGTALLSSRGRAGTAEALYVSACTSAPDGTAIAAFDAEGGLVFATRLPARGHDIAARPGSTELVVFARRPGNWAAVVDRQNGMVLRVITALPGRHFYGHGVFQGGLLHATENAVATGEGVLGLYDPADGYRRVGELSSHGIGPHDLAVLPQNGVLGPGLLVANGGIRTHPDTGREILNPDAMHPGLAIVDPSTGDARLTIDLGPTLRGLSIRHLAVMASGEAVFGCQFEGGTEALPALVGKVGRGGHTQFLEMPEDHLAAMENYIGEVGLDASGRIAVATSPRGGWAALFDAGSGRYIGRRRMSDVCGVASAPEGEGVFVVTSGNAGVRLACAQRSDLTRLGGSDLDRWSWDNHLLRL